MKKLVIFDMDGTILYTLEDIVLCMNETLRQYGFAPVEKEYLRAIIGNGIRNEVNHCLPSDTDDETREKVFETFNELYGVHCGDHTGPYEGIPELLERLKEKGYRTAVVSNKGDYAVRELVKQYFNGLLEIAAGEREGIRRKPAPDMVFEAVKACGVAIAEAVYVGDSEVDIETAGQAGMDCILVTWGYRSEAFLKEHGAKVLVSDMTALEAAIAAM
ncbi:MAG: HAD family hydrolase [Solobacterium sp.]|nr:HAD family hydrolase [Solobacterium sp.]